MLNLNKLFTISKSIHLTIEMVLLQFLSLIRMRIFFIPTNANVIKLIKLCTGQKHLVDILHFRYIFDKMN